MPSEEAQAPTCSSAILERAFNLSALGANAPANDNGYTLAPDSVNTNASFSSICNNSDNSSTFSLSASLTGNGGYTLISDNDDPIASVSPASFACDGDYTLVSKCDVPSAFSFLVSIGGDGDYILVSKSNGSSTYQLQHLAWMASTWRVCRLNGGVLHRAPCPLLFHKSCLLYVASGIIKAFWIKNA